MLKWLVNKPQSEDQESQLVTDDPLATISKGRHKQEVIYAVSRVNPLFREEEESQTEPPPASKVKLRQKNLTPESPPTDRESVRSSGYGSKEADSVSYQSDPEDSPEPKDDPMYGKLNLNSPGTVSELRQSFEKKSDVLGNLPEVSLLNRNSKFVKSIEIGQKNPLILEAIPEANSEQDENKKWPNVTHLAKALQRETDRISQRRSRNPNHGNSSNHGKGQILRFNPLVSVVAQDGRYVTSISVSPNSKAAQKRSYANLIKEETPAKRSLNLPEYQVPQYFQKAPSYQEFPLLSLQPDSLVTEDTLRMMNYQEYPPPHTHEPPDRVVHTGHDMPDFGKAMYSSFYSNSTSRDSVASSGPFRSHTSSINSLSSGRKKGPSVVQDLWEKSGLKTSGRKFLVDVNEIIHNRQSTSTSPDYQEAVRSFPSSVAANAIRYDHNRNTDDNVSNHYYYIPSSGNYEQIQDLGLDNPAFIDDTGKQSSLHSKPGSKFQHSLTNFQKRVSERGQRSSQSNDVVDGSRDLNSNSIKKDKKHPKPYPHPGKAVREFGLADTDWRRAPVETNPNPWSTSGRNQGDNFGSRYHTQDKYWNNYPWKTFTSRDTSLSSYISPHPNGGGALYQPSSILQDFTIDAYKLQKLNIGRMRKKHRRRCMTTLLIILGLACFIGAIVGISLYLTNGERMFGAM